MRDFFQTLYRTKPPQSNWFGHYANIDALSTNQSQLVAPHMPNSFGKPTGRPNEDPPRTLQVADIAVFFSAVCTSLLLSYQDAVSWKLGRSPSVLFELIGLINLFLIPAQSALWQQHFLWLLSTPLCGS